MRLSDGTVLTGDVHESRTLNLLELQGGLVDLRFVYRQVPGRASEQHLLCIVITTVKQTACDMLATRVSLVGLPQRSGALTVAALVWVQFWSSACMQPRLSTSMTTRLSDLAGSYR